MAPDKAALFGASKKIASSILIFLSKGPARCFFLELYFIFISCRSIQGRTAESYKAMSFSPAFLAAALRYFIFSAVRICLNELDTHRFPPGTDLRVFVRPSSYLIPFYAVHIDPNILQQLIIRSFSTTKKNPHTLSPADTTLSLLDTSLPSGLNS